jgi:hypothetical protein
MDLVGNTCASQNTRATSSLRLILASCKSYNFHVKSRNQWRFRVFPPKCDVQVEQLQSMLEQLGRYRRGNKYCLDFSMSWFPIDRDLGGLLPTQAIEHFVGYYAMETQRIDAGHFREKFEILSSQHRTLSRQADDLRATVATLELALERSRSEAAMLWKLNNEINAKGLSRVVKRPHEPHFR